MGNMKIEGVEIWWTNKRGINKILITVKTIYFDIFSPLNSAYKYDTYQHSYSRSLDFEVIVIIIITFFSIEWLRQQCVHYVYPVFIFLNGKI